MALAPVRTWKGRPLFAVSNVRERIASSLFSVVETPKLIFSAESQFQTVEEIVEACGGAGPVPFLMKGSTLYTLTPLTKSSILGRTLKDDSAISQEQFAAWLSDSQRSNWAIELLNRFLCLHARAEIALRRRSRAFLFHTLQAEEIVVGSWGKDRPA